MFRLNRTLVAPVLAEFLGAGILVMISLVLGQTTAVSYFIATSLAAAGAVVYLLFYAISGAHANPAVTFGLWTARRIGTLRGIAYVAAQLLGGVVAWQLYQYLTNHMVPTKTVPFSTPMWLAEVVGTGVLVLAYTYALRRGTEALNSAIAVGAGYFVAIVIAATASAGYVNPAIALGQRAWSGVYVLGPLIGGLVAANIYIYFFSGPITRTSGSVVVKRSSTARSAKR